MQVFEFRPQYL